jgi:hypothetical protein
MDLDRSAFPVAFEHFRALVKSHDKENAFTNFHEGLTAAWEGYKPRLRDFARILLSTESWRESEIGGGHILDHLIAAIEVQDSRKNLTNNLVSWQNRFGHAARDHRILLEARSNNRLKSTLEDLLFGLYRRDDDEGAIFSRLNELTGRKYPLLGYVFFLKDMDRFMPIHPTGFDRAFRELKIDFVTLRNCSWKNYTQYNRILGEIRTTLESNTHLTNIRLIDAHSFCWILSRLSESESVKSGSYDSRGKDAGRILGARERSILDLKFSIVQTAQRSRGQLVEQTTRLKIKNLGFDEYALEQHIRELMKLQEDRCALTGIPFHFKDDHADSNFLPSPDRIDSNGHYEPGNIQIVCRFINFWKADTANDEFLALLKLVRGEGENQNLRDLDRAY